MATSIVKLYNNQLLKAENNNMFSETATNSNFEYYLEHNSITKLVINDFQYIKHELNLIIKIDKEQSQINKSDSSQWTYCSIKNSDDTRTYYYYIIGMSWRAKSTIAIQLSMDTIATFWYEIQNSLDDDTNVIREHRDRFYYIDGQLHENDMLIRKIDPISEGIQVANKIMTQDKTINDDNIATDVKKWYLIYRTEVNPLHISDVPIKCYLCANKDLNINASNNNLQLEELDVLKVYTFNYGSKYGNDNNPSISFVRQDTGNYYTMTIDENNYAPFLIYDETWKVYYYNGTRWAILLPSTNVATTIDCNNLTQIFTIDKNYFITNIYDLNIASTAPNKSMLDNIGDNKNATSIVFANLWKSIDSVDRTQSNLNTIIELPYCPSEGIVYNSITDKYTWNDDIWYFDGTYRMLKLTNINSEFYRNLVQQYQIPDMVYNIKESEIATVTNNNILESKIYHSDFNQLKYVYDSFSMTLDRERVNVTSDLTTAPEMGIGYKQSNNITSNLLFDIKFDGQDTSYKKLGDIDPIILATRNNEVTIYQDSYINYMRNGYNYDKKAQAIANKQQAINVAGGVIQSVISATVGGLNIFGNVNSELNPLNKQLNTLSNEYDNLRTNYFRTAKAIGSNVFNQSAVADKLKSISSQQVSNLESQFSLGDEKRSIIFKNLGAGTQLAISNSFSIVGTISNAIATRQQQENSMAQKLAELQSQSASTVGSNDLNLLNYYNGNKLHEMKYEISDSMKKPIFDMFYYLGYTTNLQKKPDLYTRHVFNYIMCEPEFKPDGRVIFNEYLMDIKARFASGLTIWHDETINDYGCNNIEKWIFDHYMWPQEEV